MGAASAQEVGRWLPGASLHISHNFVKNTMLKRRKPCMKFGYFVFRKALIGRQLVLDQCDQGISRYWCTKEDKNMLRLFWENNKSLMVNWE